MASARSRRVRPFLKLDTRVPVLAGRGDGGETGGETAAPQDQGAAIAERPNRRQAKVRPGERVQDDQLLLRRPPGHRGRQHGPGVRPVQGAKPEERCDACQAAALPHWHPHQLRHTHATEVRRRFGLEAAQVGVGHSQARVTEVYAERTWPWRRR